VRKTESVAVRVQEQQSVSQAQGVALRSVTKKYGSVTAIENMTLDITAGSYCCLLGPSGCGKTSTLRMIAGHEEVTSGDIFIGSHRVNNLPPAKRNTAMMFQNYALFPHKTVWQNVEFGLKMRAVPLQERRTRVGEMLELVGLSHLSDRQPHALSGGQQQRVALARALVTRPQVLLLDEPLSALDESLRVKMRGELRRLQRQFGMTFIQVTHVQEEAFALSDQIVVMNHGHIDQVGSATTIFSAPASQFVSRFIGDNNIFTGTVTSVVPDAQGYAIQLEVEGLGVVFCRGQYAQVGATAACSIRSDRMRLAASLPSDAPNHATAIVNFVEFTGYVMRVSLLLEATGTEILSKVRTDDLAAHPLHEGQRVHLSWATDDCIFLPT